MHSERSWKSSWASWCSREENRELILDFPPNGEWLERAWMISKGRREDGNEFGVFSSMYPGTLSVS